MLREGGLACAHEVSRHSSCGVVVTAKKVYCSANRTTSTYLPEREQAWNNPLWGPEFATKTIDTFVCYQLSTIIVGADKHG